MSPPAPSPGPTWLPRSPGPNGWRRGPAATTTAYNQLVLLYELQVSKLCNLKSWIYNDRTTWKSFFLQIESSLHLYSSSTPTCRGWPNRLSNRHTTPMICNYKSNASYPHDLKHHDAVQPELAKNVKSSLKLSKMWCHKFTSSKFRLFVLQFGQSNIPFLKIQMQHRFRPGGVENTPTRRRLLIPYYLLDKRDFLSAVILDPNRNF
jgi:hypothetical protein